MQTSKRSSVGGGVTAAVAVSALLAVGCLSDGGSSDDSLSDESSSDDGSSDEMDSDGGIEEEAENEVSTEGCGAPCAVTEVILAGSMPSAGGTTTGGAAADNAERSRVTLLRSMKWAHQTWWNTVQNFDAQPAAGYLTLPQRSTMEQTIRPNANVAFATAIALKMGVYSQGTVGVSNAEALNRTMRLVCSIAHAHVANGGKTWGGVVQSELWAGFAGYGAWLVWNDLAASGLYSGCREQVRRMVEYEANSNLSKETPAMYAADGTYVSNITDYTRSEDNSWKLQIFALADVMMPSHPHAPSWRSKAAELAISAFADNGDVNSNTAVINGLEAKRWISGYNVMPDDTIVNHGKVNPDYMVNVAHHNAMIYYKTANRSAPQAFWFQQARNFNTLITKKFTAGFYYGCTATGKIPGTTPSSMSGTMLRPNTATVFYPNGASWGTRRSPQYWVTLAHANSNNMNFGGNDGWETAFSKDAFAMQSRYADGHTFAAGSSEDKYSNANFAHETLAIQQYASIWASKWLAHNKGGIHTQDTSSLGLLVDNAERYGNYALSIRKKWMQVHPQYAAWKTGTADAYKVGTNVLYAAANASSTPTAIVRFYANLPAGTYQIWSFWPRHTNRATNVQYRTVTSANTLAGTASVNQRDNGNSWYLVGTYSVPEGNTYVEINNASANGYVVADAVRFVKK